MKIKIVIFTPEKSYLLIKKSLKDLDGDIQYVFYKELENLVQLYNQYAPKVDAVIASGPLGNEIIRSNTTITTPLYFFELKKYELYKNLFEIILKNPKTDFSKTYIDFIDFSEKDDLFENINFPDNKPPILFNIDFSDKQFYEKTKKRYLNLLKENKVDFVFTRMSNLIPFLEENNIQYKFVFPSEDSIRSKVLSITKDLKQLKYENRNIVIGNLSIHKNHEFIKKSIEKKFKNFIIQHQNNSLEIITLKNEFLLCNGGYGGNIIAEFLENLIQEEFSIGFGCSYDIENARLLSNKALKKTLLSGSNLYYFLENEKITLLNIPESEKGNDGFNNLTNILENLNFSTQSAKKILDIARENPKITADKFSFLLNTSKRTASRILNKLEKNSLATSDYLKIPRGRPIKEYSFSL